MNVKFIYSKNHGTSKKGDEKEMHVTTADSLKAHKIGTYEAPKEDAKDEKVTKPKAK